MRNFVFIVLLGISLNIQAKSIFKDPKGFFEDVKKSAKRDIDKVAHEAKRLITEPVKVRGEIINIGPELNKLTCDIENILADDKCKKRFKEIKKETEDLKKFMSNHEKHMEDKNKEIAKLSSANKDYASAVKDSVQFKVLLKKFNTDCKSIKSVSQLNECIGLISAIEQTAIRANNKINSETEKIDVSRFSKIKEALQRNHKDLNLNEKCENSINTLAQQIESSTENMEEAKKQNNFFIIARESKNYKSFLTKYSDIAKKCGAFDKKIKHLNDSLHANFEFLKSETLSERNYFQYACLSISNTEENEYLYQSCQRKTSDTNFWFAFNSALLEEAKNEK